MGRGFNGTYKFRRHWPITVKPDKTIKEVTVDRSQNLIT